MCVCVCVSVCLPGSVSISGHGLIGIVGLRTGTWYFHAIIEEGENGSMACVVCTLIVVCGVWMFKWMDLMDPTFGPSTGIRTKYLLLLDLFFFCFLFRESEVNPTNVIGGIWSSFGSLWCVCEG